MYRRLLYGCEVVSEDRPELLNRELLLDVARRRVPASYVQNDGRI